MSDKEAGGGGGVRAEAKCPGKVILGGLLIYILTYSLCNRLLESP